MKFLFMVLIFILFVLTMRYPALLLVFIGGLLAMVIFKKQVVAMFQKKIDAENEKRRKLFEEKKQRYQVPADSSVITYIKGNVSLIEDKYFIWRTKDALNLFPAQLRAKEDEYAVLTIPLEGLNFYRESDAAADEESDLDFALERPVLTYTDGENQYKMLFESDDLVTLQGMIPEKYIEHETAAEL